MMRPTDNTNYIACTEVKKKREEKKNFKDIEKRISI